MRDCRVVDIGTDSLGFNSAMQWSHGRRSAKMYRLSLLTVLDYEPVGREDY